MRTFLLFLLTVVPVLSSSIADAEPLRVGVHEKPPYATRQEDGTWTGLGVFLWERVAKANGYKFAYQEMLYEDLIPALADGNLDVLIGEMLVNPGDEQKIDFSQPFLETHIQVAVSSRLWNPSWMHILIYAFDWGILKVFFALVPALIVVSLLMWHAERRRNATHFGGHPAKGLGSAFWFSAVTLTSTGYGDKVPITFLGRALAVVWMFISLLLVTAYTASVASTVATVRTGSVVRNADDLRHYTNGVLNGGFAAQILAHTQAPVVDFEGYQEALEALAQGTVQTVVGDSLSLEFLIEQQFQGRISILPLQLQTSRVAMGLARNSPLRKDINVALLREIQTTEWTGELREILGRIPVTRVVTEEPKK